VLIRVFLEIRGSDPGYEQITADLQKSADRGGMPIRVFLEIRGYELRL